MKISSLNLDTQELENYCKVMRKGNAPLKAAAEMTGLDYRSFRSKLFRGKFDPQAIDKRGHRVWPDMTETVICYVVQNLPAIMAVRSIEWRMVRAFSLLARKHANVWAKMIGNGVYGEEDYFQEALMALIDAIYSYTDEKTKFFTFAWTCIKRRLTTAANQTNPFGPLTNEAIAIVRRYDAARYEFNGPATDDEVFDRAGFTAEERRICHEARVKVCMASMVYDPDGQPVSDYTDRSHGFVGANGIETIDEHEDTVPCYSEIREAFELADLTPFERKVVETSIDPYYGWQTRLAESEINPKTQRPYTRAAINVILDKALKKIKDAYTGSKVA